jgi:hypothetical protein
MEDSRSWRLAVHDELRRLAELLAARDELDARIAEVVGRSARPGDVGEFIAARVFDIELAASATQAGYDGVFRSGPLCGRTVNVKTYGDVLGGIDIGLHPCDYYLVLTGPPRRGSAGVRHRPWRITGVYLFDMAKLLVVLQKRGVKISIATSLRKVDVEAARIFPESDRSPLPLSSDQAALLRLFSGTAETG